MAPIPPTQRTGPDSPYHHPHAPRTHITLQHHHHKAHRRRRPLQSSAVGAALQEAVQGANLLAMERLEGGDCQACLQLLQGCVRVCVCVCGRGGT
jgi:hypothetical protein